MALLRYFGRLTGLYPADPLAALRVDQILETYLDFFLCISNTMALQGEVRLAARKVVVAEKAPKFLGGLEKLITSGPFSTGKDISIADLAMYTHLRVLKHGIVDDIPTDLLKDFPKVAALYDAVDAHEAVKKWNSEHKKPGEK